LGTPETFDPLVVSLSWNHRAVALRAALLVLCLALSAGRATPLGAQVGSGVSQADMLARLRESGMTREQARMRLAQLGYDPSLADAYFNQIEGLGGAASPDDAQFAQALADMGLLTMGVPGQAGTRTTADAQPQYISDPYFPPVTLAADSSRIFGREIFARSRTQFDPILTGPVDPDYTIGPGDQIQLVITGDVQTAYTLQVARDGFVIIPDVGQVNVTGLSLEALRNRLFERLGRVYSGLRRDPSATTFFDVSLGRLRTSVVYVIGDVERPGAYQVSAAATVFHALHRAGGPSALGSFRNIAVRRGNDIAAQVDLYDYLLRGDASRDMRLSQGDIVFVPPAGAQVSVQGRVRRPAIYEVRDGEGLRDALGFAGGLEADAAVQRIQIDRVLPATERVPGVDRVFLDVELSQLADPGAATVPLRDGDEVRVFATLAERRNRVALTGSVFRPGLYEFRPGMTVWDLVDFAGGLAEQAFRPLAHVIRPVPETGGDRLLRVSLEANAQGGRLQDLPLADRDSVIVFATDSLLVAEFVTVEGLVKAPGRYRLAAGMTVEDLILAAGGFTEGANTGEAEVARLNPSAMRGDTMSVRTAVRLAGAVPDPTGISPRANGVGAEGAQASQFTLRHEDRVFVRRLPGFVVPQTVMVSGEVLYPGPYAIQRRDERLSNLLERAGGVTDEGYVPGARLVRDSVLVGIDLEAALDDPGREQDLILEPGDELVVPAYDATVLVRGSVAYESRVIYRRGRDLGDYLSEAGGTLPEADLGRISVQYPSGERATVHRTLWWRSYPTIEPGSTITVPPKTTRIGTPWAAIVTTSATALSALATLILAINAVK
jgi:polysaccharide export outer membrane protein